jgi:hypothetical protein
MTAKAQRSTGPLPRTDHRTVWALVRGDAPEVQCHVACVKAQLCTVSVTFGHETVLTDQFSTYADAVVRAEALRDGLIAKGWTTFQRHQTHR